MMISAKKLIKMARKCRNISVTGRKRVLSPRAIVDIFSDSSDISFVAGKGHFVIYTTDARRFELPLAYLNNNIFQELLKMSEDEFGLSSDGPITLPCDAVFMEYILALIEQDTTKGLEKTLLGSIKTSHCSMSVSLHQEQGQQLLVCGY